MMNCSLLKSELSTFMNTYSTLEPQYCCTNHIITTYIPNLNASSLLRHEINLMVLVVAVEVSDCDQIGVVILRMFVI